STFWETARIAIPRTLGSNAAARRGIADPVVSLVGGKWTTLRGFAEEVADTVISPLQRSRSQIRRAHLITPVTMTAI
ncbi:hypothetical protein ACCT11_36815, partial [Rhizobium johnstonii]|uniref:hypothetical protein n=1 Tax=Rhizobium johnstonii TaxID=3019933 RepID=UPI003F94C0A2